MNGDFRENHFGILSYFDHVNLIYL